MSKYFRPWKIDEAQLLPPSVQDYRLRKQIVEPVFGQINQARGFR
jgi:hypothetical protein